ncbi:unnamed protein product [Phytophthora fragariaefolia]|uniref:Unnamed protein product n=1 Tax=Phytophthora fragariaefolia TaxID=1490495 RepID=A0A9W6XFD7_9STRA|nr:unnamed protein product [Phytophthora fragariaefolia]
MAASVGPAARGPMPGASSGAPANAPSVSSIHLALPPLDQAAVRASISHLTAQSPAPQSRSAFAERLPRPSSSNTRKRGRSRQGSRSPPTRGRTRRRSPSKRPSPASSRARSPSSLRLAQRSVSRRSSPQRSPRGSSTSSRLRGGGRGRARQRGDNESSSSENDTDDSLLKALSQSRATERRRRQISDNPAHSDRGSPTHPIELGTPDSAGESPGNLADAAEATSGYNAGEKTVAQDIDDGSSSGEEHVDTDGLAGHMTDSARSGVTFLTEGSTVTHATKGPTEVAVGLDRVWRAEELTTLPTTATSVPSLHRRFKLGSPPTETGLAPIELPQLASPPVDADCVYAFVDESKWLKSQRREEADEVKTMEIEKERNGSFGGGEIDERIYDVWNGDSSEGFVSSIAKKIWHDYQPENVIKMLSGERLGWWSAQKFDKRVRMRALVLGAVNDARARILLDTGANIIVIS